MHICLPQRFFKTIIDLLSSLSLYYTSHKNFQIFFGLLECPDENTSGPRKAIQDDVPN